MNDQHPPWKPLRRALTTGERQTVAATIEGHLGATAAAPGSLPDATPFVSIYARGALRGCHGSQDGDPRARLARAFAAAATDPRFGGVAPRRRAAAQVQVSYIRRLVQVDRHDVQDRFEAGTHGIATWEPGGTAALLLPQVARTRGLDGAAVLELLRQKVGGFETRSSRRQFFIFDTEEVVVRPRELACAPGVDAPDSAARWLAARIARGGSVAYAIDPTTGRTQARGDFFHGRAAAVIRALHAHGGYPTHVARARAWLAREIASALLGREVEAWPHDPARIAGTLALATMAGVDVASELARFIAARPEVRQSPWHAAQCAAALGSDLPDHPGLWAACVRDLEHRPWAPWTTMGARARRDSGVLARCTSALIESLHRSAPHVGGANVTAVPELALTAITIEALAPSRTSAARAACRRGRRFLTRWQITPQHETAAIDLRAGCGAFPASPVSLYLRADITARALLALQGV